MSQSARMVLQFMVPAVAVCMALGWFSGCASAPAAGLELHKPQTDRVVAKMLWTGKSDAASRMADSLQASKDPADRELGTYWKAMCWLYRGEPDSALPILENNQGKWSGGLRRVHSEAFLRLARDLSQARAAARAHHEEPAKSQPTAPDRGMQERVDALEKEKSDLLAEVSRLESERDKYQKLLKDLETIR